MSMVKVDYKSLEPCVLEDTDTGKNKAGVNIAEHDGFSSNLQIRELTLISEPLTMVTRKPTLKKNS